MNMRYYRRTISSGEKALLAALVMIDVVLLWARLSYGINADVLSGIAGTATLGAAWLLLRPEQYSLEEDALCVKRRFPKQEIRIPYSAILACDPVGRFAEFKKDADAVELILTYSNVCRSKDKKLAVHPEENMEFYESLCSLCPTLQRRTIQDILSENEVLQKLREEEKEE